MSGSERGRAGAGAGGAERAESEAADRRSLRAVRRISAQRSPQMHSQQHAQRHPLPSGSPGQGDSAWRKGRQGDEQSEWTRGPPLPAFGPSLAEPLDSEPGHRASQQLQWKKNTQPTMVSSLTSTTQMHTRVTHSAPAFPSHRILPDARAFLTADRLWSSQRSQSSGQPNRCGCCADRRATRSGHGGGISVAMCWRAHNGECVWTDAATAPYL